MDLDSSNEHAVNGPLTPSSPGMDIDDSMRMSVDDEHKLNGGVRELTPMEGHDHIEQTVAANDCIALFCSLLI